jgi:hypothetical protein
VEEGDALPQHAEKAVHGVQARTIEQLQARLFPFIWKAGRPLISDADLPARFVHRFDGNAPPVGRHAIRKPWKAHAVDGNEGSTDGTSSLTPPECKL